MDFQERQLLVHVHCCYMYSEFRASEKKNRQAAGTTLINLPVADIQIAVRWAWKYLASLAISLKTHLLYSTCTMYSTGSLLNAPLKKGIWAVCVSASVCLVLFVTGPSLLAPGCRFFRFPHHLIFYSTKRGQPIHKISWCSNSLGRACLGECLCDEVDNSITFTQVW